MRRLIAPAVLVVVLALAGCSAPSDSGPAEVATEAPTVEAPSGPESISEAFAEFDCSGMTNAGTAPVVNEGSCSVGEGELAFFWEFNDADAAQEWLDSGALEIGATDAVYTSGPLVLMARDAATAKTFAEVATPLD